MWFIGLGWKIQRIFVRKCMTYKGRMKYSVKIIDTFVCVSFIFQVKKYIIFSVFLTLQTEKPII